MSPGNDAAPGGNQGPAAITSGDVNSNPTVILALGVVVSGRVRPRLELDVPHCPKCAQLHRHRAPVEWLGGVRTGPCGMRYVLRVAMPKRVAA